MGAVELSWPSDGVALVLVDNGPRNFITWSLNDELEAVLLEIADDADVVVLGSAVDGFFLAHGHLGDNVETFTGGSTEGDPTSGLRVWKLLDSGPFVSIAAIDGQAWGGGGGVRVELRPPGGFEPLDVRTGGGAPGRDDDLCRDPTLEAGRRSHGEVAVAGRSAHSCY